MNPSQNDSFGSFSSGQGGYIGQPGAYSVEPIMINNGGAKRSKRWVWIMVPLLVLLVVVVAVSLVIKNNNNGGISKADFVSKWQPYYKLIVLGLDAKEEQDADSITNMDEWALSSVYKNENESDENYISYFKELDKSLSNLDSIDKVVGVNTFDTSYFDTAKVFFSFANIENDKHELSIKYYKDGSEGILNSVKWMADPESNTGAFGSLLYQYYYSLIDLYKIYKKSGCLSENGVDYRCAEDIDDEAKYEAISLLGGCYDRLKNFADNTFWKDFLQRTLSINMEAK
jgi:hypothetical protein